MNDELQHQLPALLPRLWRFALRLARDRHDAEDLVQRTACARSKGACSARPVPRC